MNIHDATEQAYKNGYAKGRAEVAEIFDEFERLFKGHCTCLSDWQLFYELKKKYLGEVAGNGTTTVRS